MRDPEDVPRDGVRACTNASLDVRGLEELFMLGVGRMKQSLDRCVRAERALHTWSWTHEIRESMPQGGMRACTVALLEARGLDDLFMLGCMKHGEQHAATRDAGMHQCLARRARA